MDEKKDELEHQKNCDMQMTECQYCEIELTKRDNDLNCTFFILLHVLYRIANVTKHELDNTSSLYISQ